MKILNKFLICIPIIMITLLISMLIGFAPEISSIKTLAIPSSIICLSILIFGKFSQNKHIHISVLKKEQVKSFTSFYKRKKLIFILTIVVSIISFVFIAYNNHESYVFINIIAIATIFNLIRVLTSLGVRLKNEMDQNIASISEPFKNHPQT